MTYIWNKPKGYDIKWKHKRRVKAWGLFGSKCQKCGSKKSLEFDHIKPETKSFYISRGWSKPWNTILIELGKCQLLCHKCHIDKTRQNNEFGGGHNKWKKLQHGKPWAYVSYKCRCNLCCEKMRKEWKKYREHSKLTTFLSKGKKVEYY